MPPLPCSQRNKPLPYAPLPSPCCLPRIRPGSGPLTQDHEWPLLGSDVQDVAGAEEDSESHHQQWGRDAGGGHKGKWGGGAELPGDLDPLP